MVVNNFLQPSLNNLNNAMYRSADVAIQKANSDLAFQDSQINQAQQATIKNLIESTLEGARQAGIRTEKQLLSNGVSLAKA